MQKVSNISDLRLLFHRNERPIYFISATNFNLLGIDQWVNRFNTSTTSIVSMAATPMCLCRQSCRTSRSSHRRHQQLPAAAQGRGGLCRACWWPPGGGVPDVRCRNRTAVPELGIEVWFPSAALRARCDNKMETVRIGNKAGVPSVPNALCKVDSYAHLREIADAHGLGEQLVVQTAFGDSGHTTFFISSAADFDRHAEEIIRDPEVKIMKRINCRGATLEACATRSGTLVGPC
jgi:hypothetical protein